MRMDSFSDINRTHFISEMLEAACDSDLLEIAHEVAQTFQEELCKRSRFNKATSLIDMFKTSNKKLE